MPTYFNEDRMRLDRERELEDRFYLEQQEAKRRQHELELVKLQSSVPARQETFKTIVVTLVKLPVLLVLAVMLPIVSICGREIPEALADFIRL